MKCPVRFITKYAYFKQHNNWVVKNRLKKMFFFVDITASQSKTVITLAIMNLVISFIGAIWLVMR